VIGLARRAGIALILLGGAMLAAQGYVFFKALAAEFLIERALAEQGAGEPAPPPWPWADHRPLAALEVPRLAVRRVVLSGASGSSLAFGPGHVDGTALPGETGNSVIAGHRDRWFSFMRHLTIGDEIVLTASGRELHYRVTELMVVDESEISVLDPAPDERLTLITCHPVGGAASTRQRLVAVCRRG
jgi:sortase A